MPQNPGIQGQITPKNIYFNILKIYHKLTYKSLVNCLFCFFSLNLTFLGNPPLLVKRARIRRKIYNFTHRATEMISLAYLCEID